MQFLTNVICFFNVSSINTFQDAPVSKDPVILVSEAANVQSSKLTSPGREPTVLHLRGA